jgi:hypothetical protein
MSAKHAKPSNVQFVEAAEGPAKALQSAEQPLGLVAGRYQVARDVHASRRVDSGGTIGTNPKSKASWRVSLPSLALSMIGRQRFGNVTSVRSSSRPLVHRLPVPTLERTRWRAEHAPELDEPGSAAA